MKDHYDFPRMKGRRNPYVKLLKQSVTIRLDRQTLFTVVDQRFDGNQREANNGLTCQQRADIDILAPCRVSDQTAFLRN